MKDHYFNYAIGTLKTMKKTNLTLISLSLLFVACGKTPAPSDQALLSSEPALEETADGLGTELDPNNIINMAGVTPDEEAAAPDESFSLSEEVKSYEDANEAVEKATDKGSQEPLTEEEDYQGQATDSDSQSPDTGSPSFTTQNKVVRPVIYVGCSATTSSSSSNTPYEQENDALEEQTKTFDLSIARYADDRQQYSSGTYVMTRLHNLSGGIGAVKLTKNKCNGSMKLSLKNLSHDSKYKLSIVFIRNGKKLAYGETGIFSKGTKYIKVAVNKYVKDIHDGETVVDIVFPKSTRPPVAQYKFKTATYRCHGDAAGTFGYQVGQCKTSQELRKMADEKCQKSCSDVTKKCGVNSFSVGERCDSNQVNPIDLIVNPIAPIEPVNYGYNWNGKQTLCATHSSSSLIKCATDLVITPSTEDLKACYAVDGKVLRCGPCRQVLCSENPVVVTETKN